MSTSEQEFFDKLSAQPVPPAEPVRELHKGAPDISKPVTLRNLFTHQDAHPVVIDYALTRAFGEPWYGWMAETLWKEIKETFSTQISELAKAKVRAVQTLRTTALPWDKWQIFEKVAQAVTGVVPNFYLAQQLSLDQLYCAVDIIAAIRPLTYSDEVKAYLAATVLANDVFYVPPPLDFIQFEVSQPHMHCNDCGSEEPALFHDGFCTRCSGKLAPEQGLSLAPTDEAKKKGLGQNLVIEVRYPFDAIEARWQILKTATVDEASKKLDLTKEEDVQVLKLLIARDVMNQKRKLLAEQLTTLKSWLGTTA